MSMVLEAMGGALPGLGVKFMAGLPGSGNYELIHAARAAGVEYVGSNHEAGAVGMVDGWSRSTGEIGVTMLSQGPGLTNGLTALTEAVKSRTPMVVIAIDTPRTSRHGNLNIDQAGVVRALGAGVEVVRSPGTAVTDLSRALFRAGVERVPIVLMVPLDLVHAQVPADAETAAPGPSIEAPLPATESIAAAAELVRGARRPVIVAGRGAVRSGAHRALVALGERIGAVLTVSAPAKGLFAGEDYNVGIAGSFASPLAKELLEQADLILAFGASLNAWTTGNGRMLRTEVPAIQVDLDVSLIANHRPVTLGIQADATAVAEQLADELARDGWQQEGYRSPATLERLTSHRPEDEFTPATDGDRLDPRSLTIALDRLLPADRVVTVDSGHFMGWPAKYLGAPDAAGFMYPQSFQCVGLGLGVALGAGIAQPGRISVLSIGDGGWMLSPQELDTAVRHRVPLLVTIYNDSAYGAEVHRFAPIGLEVDLVEFPERDFAAMARAVGAQGLTIRTLADLDGLAEWLAKPEGPMLLDMKIAPDVLGDWVAGNTKAALA